MKCLLIFARGSDQEELFPAAGRARLELLLRSLGFNDMRAWEVDPDDGLDAAAIPLDYDLLLIQGEPGGGRLRRSILSGLGLSLGLLGGRGELRVVGAIPLLDRDGEQAGFAIRRRGKAVLFGERPFWRLRDELLKTIPALFEEEESKPSRPSLCWLLESAGRLLELEELSARGEGIETQLLPDGDTALLLPALTGPEAQKHLQGLLGDRLYAVRPDPLEEVVGEKLREAGLRIATAESCTAGLVAARLASVPGSSQYLSTGLVTYSNEAKQTFLEVPQVLLERCGAVSAEVALAMVRGCLRVTDCDVAVAVTGIAGPGGGSPEKPVGTVHLAAATRDGGAVDMKVLYQGGRNRIRYQASQSALHLVRRILLNHS